ncbi:proteasome inhibitor PI31 subunit [Ischnura elegans]|uniref:proteasome inhibitor PI31 subunit n=1 Tax=Ischnura elegans TaxID=197161 RepID=UPI001ED87459|nr:proteasome inhibitor PI31 subunit [Ischnura elegans]
MDDKEFGWDLLYHCVESSISKKEDVMIAFVHFILIKNGFRCYGFDGEASIDNNDGSELLPPNWSNKENLTLKYKLGEKFFVLQISAAHGKIIINLLNPDKVEASNVVFEVEPNISEIKGPLRVLIPKHADVWNKVEEALLTAAITERKEPKKTEPKATSSDEKPAREWTPSNPRPSAERHRERDEFFDPLGVGRSDLDPLGRLGGGMLFQPPRRGGVMPGLGVPGGLPRGAIPPGARFDPFGPPDLDRPGRGRGLGRLSNPDHDHLPPPGYDDMFM